MQASLKSFLVTISVPEATPAVIVLSQLDGRYFDAISGRSFWTLEFVVFKKGEKQIFAESSSARLYTRSVNVEVNLDPGDYVVHVRLLYPHLRLLICAKNQIGTLGSRLVSTTRLLEQGMG